MFFTLNSENRIGYKKLSEADLGIGEKSHQTHIGLSGDSLMFLANKDVVNEQSILVHENSVQYLDSYFDRIENPDGSFRSPKIRIGDSGNSVVATMRKIAKTNTNNIWYLVYFGLSNNRVAYFMFNQDSNEFHYLKTIGLIFPQTGVKTLNPSNSLFNYVSNYFLKRLEVADEQELMDWEITSESNIILSPKRRAYNIDMERANEIRRKVGAEGERLVYEYLQEQKRIGLLSSVIWHNQFKESYFPYDFTIEDNRAFLTNIDVKTTGYRFEQKIVFSAGEIDFISTTNDPYAVYRVYKRDDNTFFRSCNQCKSLSQQISKYTSIYKNKLKTLDVTCEGTKIAVSPNKALHFDDNEIQLM